MLFLSLLALPITFLTVFFLIPLSQLFLKGFVSGESSFSAPEIYTLVSFTLQQAFWSSLLSGILGGFLAVLYSEFEFKGKRLLWRLSLLGFALPSLLVVLAMISLWGKSGALSFVSRFLWGEGSFYGWPAVLLAHVFLNFPISLFNVSQALLSRDRRLEEAALLLGASRGRVFFEITLRQIKAAFFGTFVLSFLYCGASFLVILLLGGGPRFSTLEVAIYQAIKVNLDLKQAAIFASLQFAISVVLYLVYLQIPFQKAKLHAETGRNSIFVPRNKTYLKLLIYTGWKSWFFFCLAPLLTLLLSGLLSIPSLEGRDLLISFAHSLLLAGIVATASVVLSYSMAFTERHSSSLILKKTLGFLAGFPLFISSLVVTFSLMMTWPGLLNQGWLPVICVQTLFTLPLTFQTLRAGLSAISDRHFTASRLLGANPWMTWKKIEWPLMLPSVKSAFFLSLAFSLGEVTSVLLFSSRGVSTLPLWIFRLMERYEFEKAYGAATILVLAIAGVLFFSHPEEKNLGRLR